MKRVDTSRGLLLFVDTGSLLDIAEDIQNDVEGDLGIINNITTQMAVEAGERILKREGIQFVVEQVVKHNVTNLLISNSAGRQMPLWSAVLPASERH